jgi:hypothetical protein
VHCLAAKTNHLANHLTIMNEMRAETIYHSGKRKKLRQRKLTQRVRKGPVLMPSDALYRWMLRGLALVCLRASLVADVYVLGYVACAFATVSFIALNASLNVPSEDRTIVTVQVL